MNLLRSLAIVIGIAAPALAASVNPYNSVIISTTAGTATENLSGYMKLAPNAVTPTSYTIVLDGTNGSITASSITARYGVLSGSATFTANGVNQFSITTSSGIFVPNTAGVYAGFFSGNGSALTGVAAGFIPPGAVDFSTITAALNTKLSSGAAIGGDMSGTNLAPIVIHTQPGSVDFSTITAAIALKVSKTGDTMTGGLVMNNSPITLSGSNGYITGASSITASGFFGSGLSINGNQGLNLSCTPSETVINTILNGGIVTGGVCGTAGGGGGSAIGWNLNDFTAAADGVTQDFVFSATVANSSGIFIVRDGLTMRPNADYVFTPPTSLHMNVAPAALTSSFFATYMVDLASGPLAFILNSTQTISAQQTFTQTVTFNSSPTFNANPIFPNGSTTGFVWTATDNLGHGSWQAVPSVSTAGFTLLNATQTSSGINTFSQAPVFSSGAAGNYFAMSDNVGTLNWVPGSTVRSFIAADPILIGIRVGTQDNVTCTAGTSGSCFLDGTNGYFNISPYIVVISTPSRARMSNVNEATILSFTTATARNLACQMGQVTTAGGTDTFTIRKNGSNTAVTCSVTSASGAFCFDSTNTVSFLPGDRISLFNTSSGASASNGSCYFQLAF